MTELIEWMGQYSLPVVLLLAALAGFVFVIRKTVEKAIEARFDARKKEIELLLGRQSSFKDKVLSERYALIVGLFARIERIVTNLNRLRSGNPVPDGFQRGNEIVALTEVYEDLQIHRLVIGDRYHDLFLQLAHIALKLANTKDDVGWQKLGIERDSLQKQVRELADADSGISGTSLRSQIDS